jgi:hypothetical protein
VFRRIRRRAREALSRAVGPLIFPKDEVEKVFDFFRGYADFRTLEACARETGLPVRRCRKIKKHLYRTRRLGAYSLGAGVPPHASMRERVLGRFPSITTESRILEVGPGSEPLFPPEEYPDWWGVDKYRYAGSPEPEGRSPGDRTDPEARKLRGSWEDLAGAFPDDGFAGTFALVAASHSYEHVSRPIQSRIEAARILGSGGGLALFVPDGLSDDPTMRGHPCHTLYLVPEMIREFFSCAGGFTNVRVETFRPNCDCFISAERT